MYNFILIVDYIAHRLGWLPPTALIAWSVAGFSWQFWAIIGIGVVSQISNFKAGYAVGAVYGEDIEYDEL